MTDSDSRERYPDKTMNNQDGSQGRPEIISFSKSGKTRLDFQKLVIPANRS